MGGRRVEGGRNRREEKVGRGIGKELAKRAIK